MTKNITAVIPTRSGSERVRDKNTRPFGDSSLTEIKLKIMLRLKEENFIDEILINSNCEKSIALASKYSVNYVRRDEFYASSKCDIRDYWKNVGENVRTKNFMLCQVTSPLISYETFVSCIEKFNYENSILTVTKIKDYIWKGNKPINYELPDHPKSQDLPDNFFKLNFGVCIMSVADIKKWKNLVIPKTEFFYLNDTESIDIDTELDFSIAEYLYKKT